MLFILLGCVSAATVPTSPVRALPEVEALDCGLLSATALPASAPPGLSGLGLDSAGQRWAVAERDEQIVRLGDDGAVAESKVVRGLGARDGESLAWLDDGRLAIGAEPGHRRGHDDVLILSVEGDAVERQEQLRLDYAPFGLRAEGNKGLEGLAASGPWLAAASEMVVEEDGLRDAPLWIVNLDLESITPARLRLSSDTGKVSAVELWPESDGSLSLLAIERHFGVSRLLLFEGVQQGGGLAPARVLDLWPCLEAQAPDANLEGLARDADGGLWLQSDNQYTSISTAWLLRVAAGW